MISLNRLKKAFPASASFSCSAWLVFFSFCAVSFDVSVVFSFNVSCVDGSCLGVGVSVFLIGRAPPPPLGVAVTFVSSTLAGIIVDWLNVNVLRCVIFTSI